MTVRPIEPIDRAELRATIQKWIDAHTDVDDTDGVGLLEDVLWVINAQPTLTPPNEGAKGKNVPANEPLTLEELKAEAKRQGYKLIKAKTPRFEVCLCGHNVHQWCGGPEGWMVYCKHCGLNSPWTAKNKTAVIEAWNEMIRARRRGEYRNGLQLNCR